MLPRPLTKHPITVMAAPGRPALAGRSGGVPAINGKPARGLPVPVDARHEAGHDEIQWMNLFIPL